MQWTRFANAYIHENFFRCYIFLGEIEHTKHIVEIKQTFVLYYFIILMIDTVGGW